MPALPAAIESPRHNPRSLDSDDEVYPDENRDSGRERVPTLLERDSHFYRSVTSLASYTKCAVDFGDINPVRNDRFNVDFA